MAQLDRLIRDARAAMTARGHEPNPAQRWHKSSSERSGARIRCAYCYKTAEVICKPLPNEIQIGGEAVALNCNVATNEAKEFRQWARDNYKPGTPINSTWHPVVQQECNLINTGINPGGKVEPR